MYVATSDEIDGAVQQNKELFIHKENEPIKTIPEIDQLVESIRESSVHSRNHNLLQFLDGADDEQKVLVLDSVFMAGYTTRDTLNSFHSTPTILDAN
jgi:hypothetical protein